VAVVQEPGELVLAVLAEVPDPAPVALEEIEVRHGAISATFQVIGASHLLGVRVDGQPWFHEMLSCLPIPPQDCLHHHSFVDLADYDAELAGWGYRVQVRFDQLQADEVGFGEDPGSLAGPTDPSGGGDGLAVSFPPVFGRQPVTRVGWVVDGKGLTWTTLHTYPAPAGVTAVTSRSVLRVPSGHRRTPGQHRALSCAPGPAIRSVLT
jgi:hypothetical protein